MSPFSKARLNAVQSSACGSRHIWSRSKYMAVPNDSANNHVRRDFLYRYMPKEKIATRKTIVWANVRPLLNSCRNSRCPKGLSMMSGSSEPIKRILRSTNSANESKGDRLRPERDGAGDEEGGRLCEIILAWQTGRFASAAATLNVIPVWPKKSILS